MVEKPRLRVLVTGSAGAIGQPVCRELTARGHFVRGLDQRPTPGVAESRVGDIADGPTVDAAVAGMGAAIHLAAAANDAPFLEALLRPNVIGLFHVCDASRRHGVRRLVLTSSIQALGHVTHKIKERPLRVEHGAEPSNHYGLTKLWMEEMGRMYAQTYRMAVLAVRVVWLVRNAAEAKRMQAGKGYNGYFSRGDAGRFYALAVESERPAPGEFAVLFAASKQQGEPTYDLDPARRLIGYEPRDVWPEGAPLEEEAQSAG